MPTKIKNSQSLNLHYHLTMQNIGSSLTEVQVVDPRRPLNFSVSNIISQKKKPQKQKTQCQHFLALCPATKRATTKVSQMP